jgi:VCBS repeat protein
VSAGQSSKSNRPLRWAAVLLAGGVPLAAVLIGVRDHGHVSLSRVRVPRSPILDPVRSEEIGDGVARSVKATLLRGLRESRPERIADGLAADFQGDLPIPSEHDWVKEGPVWMWDGRSSASPPPALDRGAFLSRLREWAGGFAAIDRADWHAFETLAQEGPDAFVAERAHLDVAGLKKDGRRVELHATVRAEFTGGDAAWRMRRLSFEQAWWTASALPPFADLTGSSGLDFAFSERTRDLAQAVVDERRVNTSGGLTALDFDHDGFWDVLATRAGHETVLFENDGAGGFRRSRLPLLPDAAAAKFYAWVDLDNDGAEELVGTRVLGTVHGESTLGLYTWKGGTMRRGPALVFSNPAGLVLSDFEAITPCDVNGDGLLDLVVVGYAHAESKMRPPWDPDSGMRNLLFINQGGLRFREEAMTRGLRETHFSFVAECHDFDGDGDPDLFFGNDYGNDDYYENTGGGFFRRDDAHPFHRPSFSMGISIADYDNTGRYAVSISNMYSHAGQRIIPLVRGLGDEKRRSLLRMVQGSSLFLREGSGWVDRAKERGVDVAGWAWGNVFFDFDNDGDKDLYVVNGYTSHRDADLPDF